MDPTLTGNVKMICDMSSSYCDRYINELTQQENVAIRTRAINQLGDSEKRFNLREMLVYLMKTKQYALAWEKGTELEVIDKSEALLFKSHMLRHGLGVNQNIFDALIAEIQSVKFYDLENASIQFSYGESYDEVEGAEFLFDYNFGEGSFELDTDDFIWYLSQSEDKDPLSVATRELKGIGAIDINKMRAN